MRAAGRKTKWSYKYADKSTLGFKYQLTRTSGGTHAHLWCTIGTSVMQLVEAVNEIPTERNVVSWSYDYLPKS